MSSMLTLGQEKLIRLLATNQGRAKTGLCLVEGEKNIKEAKKFLDFTFTPADTKKFKQLVSTVTPQAIAGVARIPQWTEKDIMTKNTIVVLDNVQDPGNVGTILRLCLGFKTSLVLVDSVDPANPKIIRASAGAFFKVPWLKLKSSEAVDFITKLKRPVFRLENKAKALVCSPDNIKNLPAKMVLLVGSEGQGIKLKLLGQSLAIKHHKDLESLNVAMALAIFLSQKYLN